jgi:iron complex outermembrane receptor protein
MVTIALVALAPTSGYTKELSTQSDQALIPELELIKEEESVSIASRYEQPISQAPSNVYVITDEDIRHSGATDIPTILRRIPGMEVMQTSGADFNVSIRGNNNLAANKLLVMVDGRSIYVDVAGLVHWKLLPVTLPEIKRIEVLKGPASAVYGFNAFDGIINIITKSPQEMKGTTLQFGGGEFGTISSAAIQAGTLGKLGYRFSIGQDQNARWRDRDALAFRANKFNVQTTYALSGLSKLSVSGGLVDSNKFDGPVSLVTAFAGAPSQGYADISYERPNFFVRSWWMHYANSGRSITTPSLANFLEPVGRDLNPDTRTSSDTYNVESQYIQELGSNHRLTYGGNYRHNTYSSNLVAQYSQEDRLGLYVQDEWKPFQAFTVIAGARYDLQTFINPTISPRVAFIYQLVQDHTLRVSASVAYRPPTLLETFLDARAIITLPPPIPSPPPTTTRGSENLQPEKITSYEAGYQGWFFKHRLRFRGDLFFNHISDLINFTGSTGSPLTNGGEADIYGGEAGIEYLVTHWLSGFANYSYQEVGQTFTGADVRAVPRFKYNAGLRAEWDNGLSGDLVYHHYGAATYPITQAFVSFAPFGVTAPNPRVDSYDLLNFRVAYKFWHQKAEAGYMRDAEVALSAFSALNDTHKEHPMGETIGSRVMGWLTVRY